MDEGQQVLGWRPPQRNFILHGLFFSLYHKAYKEEGIDLWGFTVENEPHGNGDSWESMLYSPEEMTDFVQHHLGPQLERDGLSEVVVLGYDQNRQVLKSGWM